MPATPETMAAVRRRAVRLFGDAEIQAAVDAMAAAITHRLRESNPLVIGVMVGAVVPLGMLLPRLDFPLEVDYVHATRYQSETHGGEISWLRAPDARVRDRVVLVVDDILDEGVTLAAIIARCQALGAREVLSAVLVDKQLQRPRALARADFAALVADDRYLFGYGMDYHGYWRNGPGIFAVET